jgi:hypothetical protein
MELEGRPHRSLGVVLVGGRRAEQGEDGVADDLVDPATERLDVGDEALEAAVGEPLDLLASGRRPWRDRTPEAVGRR